MASLPVDGDVEYSAHLSHPLVAESSQQINEDLDGALDEANARSAPLRNARLRLTIERRLSERRQAGALQPQGWRIMRVALRYARSSERR